MTLYVGTSGWQYRHWRGVFYRDVPQTRWLPYFAERFRAVEVNGTFYRLPKRSTCESWAAQTPDDFVFALKMSRFLTHVKRLAEPEEPVRRFFAAVDGVGAKVGPVLLQMPPAFHADVGRLRGALAAMPRGVRVAVEFRHESWWMDEVYDALREHGAALCLADRESRPVAPPVRTADWGYVRFHSGAERPPGCYSRAALERWAERLAALWEPGEDVFAFFNNDPHGCAVRDARVFALAAARCGLRPTRVPAEDEVRLERAA